MKDRRIKEARRAFESSLVNLSRGRIALAAIPGTDYNSVLADIDRVKTKLTYAVKKLRLEHELPAKHRVENPIR
jgi:hypothetical protein